ncbi:MAG: hypothetical protein AAFQ82_05645 [Myxococcota bacterium]
MICALLAVAALAAPFEDVNHRFTLDLPRDWQFVPEISKQGSSAFRRVHGGVPAQAAVFTFRAPKGVGLRELLKQRVTAARKEQGYRRIEEESAALGGFKAHRHRYEVLLDEKRDLKKTVEEWITVGAGFAYVLHVETLSEEFSSFSRDFARLAETFKPKDGRGSGPIKSPLIGEWAMEDDPSTILSLQRDGSLKLGPVSGTFTLNGNTLVTQLPGGAQEAFDWRLSGGTLTLASDSMGTIRYQRVR